MTESVAIRHEEQRAIDSADQVELNAIENGSAITSVGVRDEQISGETDDLGVGLGDVLRFEQDDNVLDDEVGGVRDEILRRIAMMGHAYPFSLDGNLLVYRGSISKFYEYCLGIRFAPNLTARPYVKLPRSFERIVSVVITMHLGPSWKQFHIGAPRDRGNGSTFLKAASALSLASSNSREWKYNPEPGYAITPKRAGDEGMDFVIWKPAVDRRIGQLYIVGQCACGGDWDTKFEDLRVKRLTSFFRPPTYVDMVRCFATPYMLSDGNFLLAHRDAGWTLDRARLTLMAEEVCSLPSYQALLPTLDAMYALSRKQPQKMVPVNAVAA